MIGGCLFRLSHREEIGREKEMGDGARSKGKDPLVVGASAAPASCRGCRVADGGIHGGSAVTRSLASTSLLERGGSLRGHLHDPES
jgi:hypothetical protein